jgi:hypothetical protein
MKLACRVTIICVCLSSPIMSIFEDFAFLTASSSPERPAPGNWNSRKVQPWTIPPHPGLRTQAMIAPAVGPTLTIVKLRGVPRPPPRPVPPLLRSSRVYPYRHLTRQANICTHFLLWHLLPRRIRPGRPRRHPGTPMTWLGQEEGIIPALLRTARLSRASA